MRPIRLEFAGLQSYRERQVVDFAELLGGGLFGIFGPTGSGKSTILDAITLALYGKVGRAERGTIGILNQGENRLEVKFTFALGGDAIYRVERSYKREKESESIRSEHCRLVEVVSGLERVLADKERDVTAQVTDILGLQLDDFTRAVVLPQGQFAEFLHLSGAQRTQMLQRIFSLMQYGDRLSGRLKRRLEAVRSQLDRVQAEQVGLGDASDEAVVASEAQLLEAERSLAAVEQDLASVEHEIKGWERVWELQQESQELEGALRRWQEGSPAADGWRAELERARRAEQVRPHLEAMEQAGQQMKTAAQRLDGAEQAYAQAMQREAMAVAAHGEARNRRAAEGPRLLERRAQLQRAAALEAGLAEAQSRVADLEDRVAKGRQLTAAVAGQIAEGDNRLAQMAQEEAALRGRLAAVDVDGEYRAEMQEAQRLLDRLRETERSLDEAMRRLAKGRQQAALAQREAEQARLERESAQEMLAERDREIQRLEEEPPADQEDLRAGAAWLSRAEEQVRAVREGVALLTSRQAEEAARAEESARLAAEAALAAAAEGEARAALEAAREERDRAQAELEKARQHQRAAELRLSLRCGEPCPVCGSLEHPLLAVAGAGSVEAVAGTSGGSLDATAGPAGLSAAISAIQGAAQVAEQALREAEGRLEHAVRQRADGDGRAAAARARHQESVDGVAQATSALDAARERLPETWRGLNADALPAALEAEAAENAERSRRYQEWQTSLADLRQRRDEQARMASATSATASAKEATWEAAQKGLNEGQAEVAAQQAEVAVRQAKFDAAVAGLKADSSDASRGSGQNAAWVEAESRRMEAADREAAGLRKSMDALRQGQQAQEQALVELRRNRERYVQALHEREMERAQAQQSLAESEAEWTRLAGGQPAGPQVTALEEALRQMESAEAEAARAREEVERVRSRTEADRAAAHEAHIAAARRLEEAEGALTAALERAGFVDAAAAADGLRPLERQSALDRQIRSFEQEGDRLHGRVRQLEEQLAGRSLSAEEWQSWQDRRENARSAAAVRRDERARASQVAEDLKAKQKRWQELDGQRSQLTASLNYLEELKSLLRGNAFVDFLAEEQMTRVAAEASLRLGQLTRHRYALETVEGGGFVIRDDGNGGTRRSVTTLSGGETFLTSLSLALALSAQIQLRGHYPLEFFFLDEGFGTLDPELLDVVMTTLERLHFENLHVGVISHVPELRSRLQRRVIVEPAEPGGRGSQIRLERA